MEFKPEHAFALFPHICQLCARIVWLGINQRQLQMAIADRYFWNWTHIKCAEGAHEI